MAPSARPRHRLYAAGSLGGAGAHAGTRPVRRAVPGRRARRVRRLWRIARCRLARRGAGAEPRSRAADLRDGACHARSRVRHHREHRGRAAFRVRAPDEHAGSPDRRPHRLERGDRLPGFGRARVGARRAGGPRHALRCRRRGDGCSWQAVARELGRRCGSGRPRQRDLCRPRARAGGARARRGLAHGGGASLRAVAAARAGDLPGRRFGARPAFCGGSRGMRVRERHHAGADRPAGGRSARSRRRAAGCACLPG